MIVISSCPLFPVSGISFSRTFSLQPIPVPSRRLQSKIPNTYFFNFCTLSGPPVFFLQHRAERIMRLCLIPVGHAGHIILPFKKSSVSHSDLLDRYFQIFLKTDGILNMPPVKSPH